MKTLRRIIILILGIIVLSPATYSQQTAQIINNLSDSNSRANPPSSGKVTVSSAEHLALLEERKRYLEKYLASLQSTSKDYQLTADWIRDLTNKISELKHSNKPTTQSSAPSSVTVATKQATCVTSLNEPGFCLSVPVDKATAESTQLNLAWTEDQNTRKNYVISQFIVEVAATPNRFQNGRFQKPVFQKIVSGNGSQEGKLTIPEGVLASGNQYYWQVLASYIPNGSNQESLKGAKDGPKTFKTAQQNFAGLENIGLTLQRTVAGDDATEAAEFGFLKTFNGNTVYTANFALIYDAPVKMTRRTSYGFQSSVQGSLTSNESESEDALQFRAGALINHAFLENSINGFTLQLGAKYETDQKFKVGKVISENMITPTVRQLGIGFPFGSRSIVQFNWRPFFYFDVGRTHKRGDSEEVDDTVLRFSPRVRGVFTLHFLRRALNVNNTYVYFDNQFYRLPLEDKKNRNFFTSGFQLLFTKNFGFGLTYKNGESAPKFKRVNTFGGVLTVRFGKSGE